MKASAAVPLSTRSETGWSGIAASLVRRARLRCSVALAILATLTLISLGEGAPGDLDPTFGVGGKVTTDFGGLNDGARALVQQPDGKLVAAGQAEAGDFDFALARYLPDGSLDPTFGTGGMVTTDFGTFPFAAALVQQADGKLVAGGPTDAGGCCDFALVRYLSDGSLDPTFGVGGKVTTDFGGFEAAAALVQQPDGKLVAAGLSTAGSAPATDFALARYLPDGSLDPTFGVGGKVTTDFEGGGASALVLQPDGKLVAAGNSRLTGLVSDFALARYLSDGSLDPTFGVGGKVTTDFGGFDRIAALILQSDGKLVAGGNSGSGSGLPSFALVRYLPDGSLDPTFGVGGKVTTDFEGGAWPPPWSCSPTASW